MQYYGMTLMIIQLCKSCKSLLISLHLTHCSYCSPVIKVGSRATDESADKETVLSESDDECQQTFVKNKRVKSNLF